MTSLYLSPGQRNLCYLLTEKGSQETGEHSKAAGPCVYILRPDIVVSVCLHADWGGGGALQRHLLTSGRMVPVTILQPHLLSRQNCPVFHLLQRNCLPMQVTSLQITAGKCGKDMASLPSPPTSLPDTENLGGIVDSFVILILSLLSITNSWQAAFEIHTPSILAVISPAYPRSPHTWITEQAPWWPKSSILALMPISQTISLFYLNRCFRHIALPSPVCRSNTNAYLLSSFLTMQLYHPSPQMICLAGESWHLPQLELALHWRAVPTLGHTLPKHYLTIDFLSFLWFCYIYIYRTQCRKLT